MVYWDQDAIEVTRDDLVRLVLGQQWAVACCIMMCAKPKPAYLAAVLRAQIPSPADIVDEWLR